MSHLTKEVSIDELSDFIEEVIEFSDDIKVFLLRGDLASGKTTFVKEFVKQTGSNECVTSPTFSVQNVYDGKVFHYDIYQKGVENFLSEGLLEELDKEGYHFVEWADDRFEKLMDNFFIDYVTIDIEKAGQNKRVYKVKKCIH